MLRQYTVEHGHAKFFPLSILDGITVSSNPQSMFGL